jgi:uncharacterized protein (TIGR02246 family)
MEVAEVIDQFNEAWIDHDLDRALSMLTDDCVFDATGPAPDGTRCQGREAIRAAWKPIFDDAGSRFDIEEMTVIGDRAVALWQYNWADGHVRGVDVFRIRDGRIAEKFSYVKG